MAIVRTWLMLLALVLAAMPGCKSEEDADIRSVFDEYTAALARRDTAAFLKVIDPQIVERYDGHVKLAQKGSKQAILRLPPYGIMDVVAMRHRLSPDELKSLTGTEWIRRSIAAGTFMFQDTSEEYSIGRINLRLPRANAELIIDGDKTGLKVEFVKVEGCWLVNDDFLEPWFERFMEKRVTISGQPMINIIMFDESEETGKRVDPAVLDAPPAL